MGTLRVAMVSRDSGLTYYFSRLRTQGLEDNYEVSSRR
jgi:hypothetical protein